MYRHKDGWRVQWTHNGQRRSRKFTDATKAKRFEMELELGIADTSGGPESSPTFKAFAERWLRDYCQVHKRESGWKCDERTIALHLTPVFGEVRLKHLQRSHLIEAKTKMAEVLRKNGKPLTPRTINHALGLAKSMMNFAVDLGLLGTNPFRGIKGIKQPVRQPAFWPASERDEFLARAQAINPAFAELVLVASHTGLRLGELAALTRASLVFDRRKIVVDGTFSQRVGKRFAPKNGRTEEVPMNQLVFDTLAPKRFLQPNVPVFAPSLFHNCRRQFARLCKLTDSRPIRFHDLRHTFASTLAMAGVDLMLIQKLMRHRSYQMTLRYAHLPPDVLKGATEILCTQSAHGEDRGGKSGAVGRS